MIVKLKQAIRYRPAVLLTVAGRMRKRRVEVYESGRRHVMVLRNQRWGPRCLA